MYQWLEILEHAERYHLWWHGFNLESRLQLYCVVVFFDIARNYG